MNKILNSKESKNENTLITNYFKDLTVKIKKENDYDNSLDYLNEEINRMNSPRNLASIVSVPQESTSRLTSVLISLNINKPLPIRILLPYFLCYFFLYKC